MSNRPTGPSGLRGRVNQPRMIPKWWTMTPAQSREYHFIGPRDFRPPSQRNPGPARPSGGAYRPPPSISTTYSRGDGQWRPAQVIGAGNTPTRPGGSVPSIKPRPNRQLVPSGRGFARHLARAKSAARLARLLARMNPYFNALDIGFQLLDGWSKWGPQQEGIPGVPATWDLAGWTQCCSTDQPYEFATRHGSASPCGGGTSLLCGLVNQAVGQSRNEPGQAIPAMSNGGEIRMWSSVGSIPNRYTLIEVWRNPSLPGRNQAVEGVPGIDPVPGKRTIQRSPASVVPAPASITEHMREPVEGKLDPIVGRRRPLPVHNPSQRPANTVEISPGGVHVPPQEPHVLAPPSGGKELKINTNKGSPFYRAISDLYNGVTEAGDFMDVLADSIKGNPCKGLRLAAKTVCIGENLHNVDVDDFIEGLILNHVEDKIVGTFLSWSKKSPYGVMTPTTQPSRGVSVNKGPARVHYL